VIVPVHFAQLFFWVVIVVCIVAHTAIVRSVLKSPSRRFAEVAWAVVPAIVLAAVLAMTWRSMHVSG
jgi:TRAP-type mannitol/chloroaromatic compound transport system permease small subunit